MQTTDELKQCSRCRSVMLLQYFETNRQGELYRTCNNCRKVDKTYKDTHVHKYRTLVTCPCGSLYQVSHNTNHEKSNKHLIWKVSQT